MPSTPPTITQSATELSASNHVRYTKIIKEINSDLGDLKNKHFSVACNVYILEKEPVLWQGAGFTSLIECIKSECDIEKSMAYHYLQAGKYLVEEFSSSAGKNPTHGMDSIRQVLAISMIPKPQRQPVLDEIEKKRAKATPARIKQVFKVLFPSPPADAKDADVASEKIILDKTGYPIPEIIQKKWLHATERAKSLLLKMDEIKSIIHTGVTSKQPDFCELSEATVYDLTNDKKAIKRLLPYAVCICEAVQPETCTTCNGRGYISERLWGVVPEDLRELRSKKISKSK